MQKMTVNDILQKISVLPPEDQYVIAEILSKRVRDLKRKQLVIRAQEPEKHDKSGNGVSRGAADLMQAVGDD
ncbi:MAG: hypothetical protein BWK80_40385 [Desulfobacteraceae bacterium IS3]|nr:MAG: hypothetical protein BWK80_40385 [Desulfobacteraceae bacterium IS3]